MRTWDMVDRVLDLPNKSTLRAALEQLESDREALHLGGGLILSAPGQRMTGDTFRTLLSFGVYAMFRQQVALYVGYSNRPLNRISEPTHQQQEAIASCDQVHFYPCSSESEAKALETTLIRRLCPKYNIMGQL